MATFALKTALPTYLREEQRKIEKYAKDFGLDFYPTIFEVLSFAQMNEVAAYGGFPSRYPHWRFGMEYERLSKSHEYGLSRIYEMVINNNPAIAYLLEGNSIVDQKLVMAHVYAHVDFFKNNYTFGTTNQGEDRRTGEAIRKWIDTMANHGAIVRRWANRVGIERMEEFVDACLSLENLIDPQLPFMPPKAQKRSEVAEEVEQEPDSISLLPVEKDYMESFINPEEFVEAQRRKMEQKQEVAKKYPESRVRDILGFLVEKAPLERWEREVLTMIRGESYYFYPQMQTKVMNEGWACTLENTLVFTDKGIITMGRVVAGEAAAVADGEQPQRVYDRHAIRDQATITVQTRRGLRLSGSENHRIRMAGGGWRRLDELRSGDQVEVAGGRDLWPADEVRVDWRPAARVSLHDVAQTADVSVWTVLRHRAGRPIRRTDAVAAALEAYESDRNLELPQSISKRLPVRLPDRVDADLGAFLGYLVGDGHISKVKRVLGLTTGDEPQAHSFAQLAHRLFGLHARVKRDEGRLRVLVHSETLSDFLTDGLGLTHGPSARDKRVPDAILRSPEPVVRAFLRAYFDCDGHAGKQGVILATSSEALAEQVQLLLLNYGILSRRRSHKDGCFHLHVAGASAVRFAERIGFGLARKQAALEQYVADHHWYREERWTDEVVSLEHGRADVYDISVEETHRYAAQGFVNHNSYWHSRLMTEKICDASEIVDYADRNAGVLSTAGGQLNPYKLGVELYRHIEERWDRGQFGKEWDDCDDLEARRHWDRRTGLGQKKIFEVRALYNDVTFIDEFLTPDFVVEQKLYTFGYNARNDRWEIETREFESVKKKLLFSLTNAGNPVIYVEDANYQNRGELLLVHDHQGVDLRIDWARDVLKSMERIWHRPVEIHTLVDGKPAMLRFDGNEHVQRPLK